MQLVSLILIRWIVIYPVDSAIQRLNNRGQIRGYSTRQQQQMTKTLQFTELLIVFQHVIFYHFVIWLNTVLQAVSGNSRASAFFKLDKQTWRRKSNGTKKMICQIYSLRFCDIWQNFYFYRIWNNENFKMEVEQTNFVTHLIIQYNYIIDYLKTRRLKFSRISLKW